MLRLLSATGKIFVMQPSNICNIYIKLSLTTKIYCAKCTFVNDVRLKNRKNKEKSQNTLRGGEERWSEAKPNGDDTQCL